MNHSELFKRMGVHCKHENSHPRMKLKTGGEATNDAHERKEMEYIRKLGRMHKGYNEGGNATTGKPALKGVKTMLDLNPSMIKKAAVMRADRIKSAKAFRKGGNCK